MKPTKEQIKEAAAIADDVFDSELTQRESDNLSQSDNFKIGFEKGVEWMGEQVKLELTIYAKQKCKEQKMLVAEEILRCTDPANYNHDNNQAIRLICKNADEPNFD